MLDKCLYLPPYLTAATRFLSEDDPNKREWVQRRARLHSDPSGNRKRPEPSGSGVSLPEVPPKRPNTLLIQGTSFHLEGLSDAGVSLRYSPTFRAPNRFDDAFTADSTTPGFIKLSPSSLPSTSYDNVQRDSHNATITPTREGPILRDTVLYAGRDNLGHQDREAGSIHRDALQQGREHSKQQNTPHIQRLSHTQNADGSIQHPDLLCEGTEKHMAEQMRFGMSGTVEQENAGIASRDVLPDHDYIHCNDCERSPRLQSVQEGEAYHDRVFMRDPNDNPDHGDIYPLRLSPAPTLNELFDHTTPDQSPTYELDISKIQERVLIMATYDHNYDKAYKAMRDYLFNKELALKIAFETTKVEDNDCQIAYSKMMDELHNSHTARRKIKALSATMNDQDLALDLLLNKSIQWADNPGLGGMQWCMKTLDDYLANHAAHLDISDDED